MKVSVIVPVYNCIDELSRCVKSIVSQTYSELEIILVDDGSTDGSSALCDKLADRDARIKVIHQANKGASAARNAGLKTAVGDYITFVDSDDSMDEDLCGCLLDLAVQHNAEVSQCGYKRIDGADTKPVGNSGRVVVQNRDEALDCFLKGIMFTGSVWAKLYRSDLIKNIRFDEDLCINEDVLFNFKAFSQMKTSVFADLPKYNYYVRPGQSICFVTNRVKKIGDSCSVNRYMYTKLKGTRHEADAASRYIRTLRDRFLVCEPQKSQERRSTREEMAKVAKNCRKLDGRLKVTVFMIRFCPGLYKTVYKSYDKVRKPNWDVK